MKCKNCGYGLMEVEKGELLHNFDYYASKHICTNPEPKVIEVSQ